MVLSTRYDVEGGQLKEGGREASVWWRDIHTLCKEGWFSDHVGRSIGNGKHTLSRQILGLVKCRLESGSIGYMSCRCLKGC